MPRPGRLLKITGSVVRGPYFNDLDIRGPFLSVQNPQRYAHLAVQFELTDKEVMLSGTMVQDSSLEVVGAGLSSRTSTPLLLTAYLGQG